MSDFQKQYDLEERTLEYSKQIVRFAKLIPRNVITLPLINQFIRAGTSPGANYREANGASSKNDFTCKISHCKKELKETHYWIEVILEAEPELTDRSSLLIIETEELIRIFSKIYFTSRNND